MIRRLLLWINVALVVVCLSMVIHKGLQWLHCKDECLVYAKLFTIYLVTEIVLIILFIVRKLFAPVAGIDFK